MKHLFYSLILVMVLGCSGIDKPKKPKNLISKDKMSEIMYDLYMLNAAKGINRKILEANGIMPLEYLYKKYSIDSLQFAESNTFYAYDSKAYSAIIEKVKKNLEKHKDLYETMNLAEQKTKDSINLANKKAKDTLKVKEPTLP